MDQFQNLVIVWIIYTRKCLCLSVEHHNKSAFHDRRDFSVQSGEKYVGMYQKTPVSRFAALGRSVVVSEQKVKFNR